MIFGMTYLTFIHVAISLVAILLGIPVVARMISPGRLTRMTTFFLAFTIAATGTGFLLPSAGVTPAFATGIVSGVTLVLALYALYGCRLSGAWRAVYVGAVVFAFYLNVLALVVQAFQKIRPLHALAPSGSEPPFLIAQGVVLLLFVALGWYALQRFEPVRRG
ncbi:MAG: hypothetical protein IT548_14255 [Alphaproteobacteria bacterium]|nr:hypothetical protein [Alphaproteobacteria bacterium]